MASAATIAHHTFIEIGDYSRKARPDLSAEQRAERIEAAVRYALLKYEQQRKG